MHPIFGYLFALLYAAFCIGFAALLYHLGVPKRYSRKTVHVLVGFEWVILSHFFGVGIPFFLVCAVFTAGLYLDYKKSLLSLMSSDGTNAPGTVYYGISMTVMSFACLFLPDLLYPFGIAVFCTSLGDGMAGVVGQAVKKHNPKIYGDKSLFGTLSCFAFSLLSAFAVNTIYSVGLPFYALLCIALFASEIELISVGGLDNIFLPLGVCALTYGFLVLPGYLFSYGGADYRFGILRYLVPILLTLPVVAAVRKKELLTGAGIAAAVGMDIAVSAAFGNFGFILLLSFLAGGALIDRFKERFRAFGDETAKASKKRDFAQVFANGCFPTLVAVLSVHRDGDLYMYLLSVYTAVLAEAFADTCASGFGAAAKRTYDPFKRCKVGDGLSGGMSLLGTFSAFLGAFLFAALAFVMSDLPFRYALTAWWCGFLGTVFDSFLGSVAQVKYRCKICGKLTEKKIHCGEPTEYASGIRRVDNDFVNFASGAFTVLLALIVPLFFN